MQIMSVIANLFQVSVVFFSLVLNFEVFKAEAVFCSKPEINDIAFYMRDAGGNKMWLNVTSRNKIEFGPESKRTNFSLCSGKGTGQTDFAFAGLKKRRCLGFSVTSGKLNVIVSHRKVAKNAILTQLSLAA